MGAKQTQDRQWDRQVLISIFQKDPSAWATILSHSHWRTRRIGVSQLTVLQAAEWTGNTEIAARLRAEGMTEELVEPEDCFLPLDSQSTADGQAHQPRCSPQLRRW